MTALPSAAGRVARNVWPPIVFGIAFLSLWEGFVRWRHIKPIILPKPSDIWTQIRANVGLLWDAAWVSGTNAFVGLLLGIALGLLVAMATNRFPIAGEVIGPLSIAVNAIPIIVIVSILNKMFPLDTQIARRAMVTLIVFFVVFVNVSRGLRQTNAIQVELMRSYASTPRQLLTKVRLPNALPHFFTALKIAAPLSVITAFVAEYFGGTQDGLGQRIPTAIKASRDALGWAYIFAACMLGLAFFVAASIIEYLALPWKRGRART
jgi:NitT/TauT family transport system permease protein